jgi:hypothetical protein
LKQEKSALRHFLFLICWGALAALVLAAAACGGDDDATPAVVATTAATDGDDKTVEPTSSSSDGGGPTIAVTNNAQGGHNAASGACLLSDDEVADAIGQPVTSTEILNSSSLLSCQYATANYEGVNLTVIIDSSNEQALADFNLGHDGETVNGLGDQAEWQPDPDNALNVLKGTKVLGVQFFGLSGVDRRAAATELAKLAVPRLP